MAIDATFGYTDARYTKDAYPSGAVIPTPAQIAAGAYVPKPLVADGDAIAGPNGIGTGYSIPPWTTTIGAEYHIPIREHDSFIRLDYEYAAADKWTHSALDPRTSEYDPTGIPMARQSFASLRTGTTLSNWLVSFFVDNLTDTHTITNYNHQTNNAYSTPAFRYISYRPRTFGITATYRH